MPNNNRQNSGVSKLHRSGDRIIAGVCSGLGEFFQVDASIIRLIFILITIFGGGGILLYLILWLIIPSQGTGSDISKENVAKNADEIKNKAKELTENIKVNTANLNSRQVVGFTVLILGVILLLDSFGFLDFYRFWKYLPAAVIIIIGISILKNKRA